MMELIKGLEAKAPTAPDLASAEKPRDDSATSGKEQTVTIATSPLVVSEVQLAAATGGAELSCSRCMLPFGVVVLIAGLVVTAVAYSFNTHGSTISVLGLVLLSAGLLLVAASAACWKVGRERQRRERRRESQAALVATRGTAFV